MVSGASLGNLPQIHVGGIWGCSFYDTIGFFYSLSSQIIHYLGCLHSGVLAWISSPKKVSFSFVYVHSSSSQSSLAVPGASSVLQGDAGPAAVALANLCSLVTNPTPCPVCARSAQPWGAAPLGNHFCLTTHTWHKEPTCRNASLGFWRGVSLMQNCSELVGCLGWKSSLWKSSLHFLPCAQGFGGSVSGFPGLSLPTSTGLLCSCSCCHLAQQALSLLF